MGAADGFLMFLTEDEIRAASGRAQRHAQQKALTAMGIIFKLRADGSLLVLRSHIEAQLGGAPPAADRKKKEFIPNWGAANAKETQ
jgi:hypothetical protein